MEKNTKIFLAIAVGIALLLAVIVGVVKNNKKDLPQEVTPVVETKKTDEIKEEVKEEEPGEPIFAEGKVISADMEYVGVALGEKGDDIVKLTLKEGVQFFENVETKDGDMLEEIGIFDIVPGSTVEIEYTPGDKKLIFLKVTAKKKK